MFVECLEDRRLPVTGIIVSPPPGPLSDACIAELLSIIPMRPTEFSARPAFRMIMAGVSDSLN
jgi:hypothetical protein